MLGRQPDELIRSGDVSLVFVQYAILFSYAGSEVNHKWPSWTGDGVDSDDGVKGESAELYNIRRTAGYRQMKLMSEQL